MDMRRIVGQNVHRVRTRLGISQEELAFRSGLHRTYVSGVDRGVRNPTIIVVGRLARALQVAPAELVGMKPKRVLVSATTGTPSVPSRLLPFSFAH